MARVSSGKAVKRAANKVVRKSGRAASKAQAHYLRMGPKGSTSSSSPQSFSRGPAGGSKKTNHHRGLMAADKATRRADAEERQGMRDEMTATEQLERLDQRLGVNLGAEKERKRLIKEIEKEAAKKTKKVENQTPEEERQERRKLKAKERNASGVSGGRMERGGRVDISAKEMRELQKQG